MDTQIGVFIILLIIVIVVTLVCREVYCWYTKQNRIIELLKQISKKLGKDEEPPKKEDTEKPEISSISGLPKPKR